MSQGTVMLSKIKGRHLAFEKLLIQIAKKRLKATKKDFP
jgi:hypothetical protein